MLDAFLGSGTTMIAAERTGRRCDGMAARGEGDEVLPKLSFPRRGQLGGDAPEMPVRRQLGLRAKVLEADSAADAQYVAAY